MAAPHYRKLTAGAQESDLVSRIAAGASEFREAIQNWRVWHLMGSSEIRKRFARSRLGHMWVVLTTATTFSAMAVVWAVLWRVPLAQMLPYVAWSFVAWFYISGTIQESTECISANKGYLINQYMPPTNIILSVVYKNGIIFAMNTIIPIAISLWFGIIPGPSVLFVIFGIIIAVIFATSSAVIISIVCTRFRDLVQIILAVMQIMFYLTPILWKPEQIPQGTQWLVFANPLASILSLVRDPLLGRPVASEAWIIAVTTTALMAIAALSLLGTYRRRLIYWL